MIFFSAATTSRNTACETFCPCRKVKHWFARTGFGNLKRGLGTNLFSAHLLPDDVTDLRLNLLHGGRLVTSLLRRDVVGPPHPGDERGVALTASDVVRGAAQVLLQQLVILRIEDELFQISRL